VARLALLAVETEATPGSLKRLNISLQTVWNMLLDTYANCGKSPMLFDLKNVLHHTPGVFITAHGLLRFSAKL
jgi:hypothetical protein